LAPRSSFAPGTITGEPNRPPLVELAYAFDQASNLVAKADARHGSSLNAAPRTSRPGDTVATRSGSATVVRVAPHARPEVVYNLHVEGTARYLVGACGVVVHNNPCDRAAREAYEAAVEAAQRKFPGKAGRIEEHHVTPKYLGGDPHGPTVPIDAAYHQEITNAFRAEWGYGRARPSAAEVQRIMDRVYRRFPLPQP
jgi:hypothetical protein